MFAVTGALLALTRNFWPTHVFAFHTALLSVHPHLFTFALFVATVLRPQSFAHATPSYSLLARFCITLCGSTRPKVGLFGGSERMTGGVS